MTAAVPLRRVARLVNGGTPIADSAYWGGDVPWATPIDLARVDGGLLRGTDRTLTVAGRDAGSRVVPADSIIMSIRAPIGYLVRTSVEVAFNQGCRGIVPLQAIDSRFLQYCLTANREQLVAAGTGSTFQELSSEALASTPITWHAVDEQRRIADFLDDQVGRLDEATRELSSAVDVAAEGREAALTACLLGRGQSGTPARWQPFGICPAGWTERALRSVRCLVQTGPFGSQLHSEEYVDDGWPVVNPAGIGPTGLHRVPGMSVDDATRHRLRRHVLMPGDVVFGRRGELGRAATVTPAEAGWLCGTGSLVVRLVGRELHPDYLSRVLRTRPLRHYFEMVSVGATMSNLNTSILMAMPLFLPPRRVQDEIIERSTVIEQAHGQVGVALGALREGIDERKRALITAAVTGDFDVSSASNRATKASVQEAQA